MKRHTFLSTLIVLALVVLITSTARAGRLIDLDQLSCAANAGSCTGLPWPECLSCLHDDPSLSGIDMSRATSVAFDEETQQVLLAGKRDDLGTFWTIDTNEAVTETRPACQAGPGSQCLCTLSDISQNGDWLGGTCYEFNGVTGFDDIRATAWKTDRLDLVVPVDGPGLPQPSVGYVRKIANDATILPVIPATSYWTPLTGLVSLIDGEYGAVVYAMSDGGSLAGIADGAGHIQATVWHNGVPRPLPDFPNVYSVATAVSSDGNVVAGLNLVGFEYRNVFWFDEQLTEAGEAISGCNTQYVMNNGLVIVACGPGRFVWQPGWQSKKPISDWLAENTEWDGAGISTLFDVAETASGYHLLFQSGEKRYYAQIGDSVSPPSCPDADADGAPACDTSCDAGGLTCDHDDGDPTAYPGATEICGNGVDEDGDGSDEPCPTTGSGIDFGPGNVEPAPGHLRADGQWFDPNRGFGWLIHPLSMMPTRARTGCADAPAEQQTLAFSYNESTWEQELPNGRYRVTATVGDCRFSQGRQRVTVEGRELIEADHVIAGQPIVKSRTVLVLDGRLSLTIGTGESFTVLNALEIVAEDEQPELMRSINFHRDAPWVQEAPGFEPDFGAPYDDSAGHGWDRDLRGLARNRGLTHDRLLDGFVFAGGNPVTFELALPVGTYDVQLGAGDAAFAQGPHRVTVEGRALFEDEPTLPGRFIKKTMRRRVADGRLTIEIGGSSGYTMLNYVSVAKIEPGVSINFQPEGVPLPGYDTQTDHGRSYTPQRGYGWEDDSLRFRTRDRDLLPDDHQKLDTLIFSSEAKTWRMDLPNGTYGVYVVVGDPAYTQGPHRVRFEGTPFFDGEVTPANTFLEQWHCVEVTDGELTLEMGGTEGFTTLNHLFVRADLCPE